jgi:uncharacterized membrane protein
MRRLRAYLRFDRRESRLPAAIAILVVAGLYLIMPAQLSLGPAVIFPIVAVLGVLPLTIADALGHEHPWQRALALTLLGFTAASNGASIALLVRELIFHTTGMSGRQLLVGALLVWAANVIVFALWYWELDRGGPAARAMATKEHLDFLFPQMVSPEVATPEWEPQFPDYFYLSFTNATAFSPTDTLPLTRWTKMLMLLQSAVSLSTVALVIARAINILK